MSNSGSSYIEFPNMFGGLKFEIDNVAFEILGLPLYWYGIIIGFGFMLGVLLINRSCEEYGFKKDDIMNLILFILPASIIGARLYYIMFKWEEYGFDFLKIINIRSGGLAIYGGIIAAIVVVFIYAKKNKKSVLSFLDLGMPFVALAQAIGRWGNFVNQEAYGIATDLPWGMTGSEISIYSKQPVHPTFLYESLWNIVVFLILIKVRKARVFQGAVFYLYLILYGLGRMWIEGLRTDSLFIGSFRVSQLLAVLCVVVFLIIFYINLKRRKIVEVDNR